MEKIEDDREARLKRLYYSRAISELMKKHARAKLVKDVVSMDADQDDEMNLAEVGDFIQEFGDGSIDLRDLEEAFSKVEEFLKNLEQFMSRVGQQSKEKGKEPANEPAPPSGEESVEDEKVVDEKVVDEIDVEAMRSVAVGGPQFLDEQPAVECPRCEAFEGKRSEAFEQCEDCRRVDKMREAHAPLEPVGACVGSAYDVEAQVESPAELASASSTSDEDEEQPKKSGKKLRFFRRVGSTTVAALRPRDKSKDEHKYVHVGPWVPLAPKWL